MPKITNNLLKRSTSKNILPKERGDDEIPENFLKEITHLYLQEKNIENIENLDFCTELLALYLYDNKIDKIDNVSHLVRLNYLYLHSNMITKMENLQTLINLTCLKLGGNRIQVVEGLESLIHLEQLWLENQDLPDGISLSFQQDSLKAISNSLRFLNVSGNRLMSLTNLISLGYLQQLFAENNLLKSLQDLVNCLVHWPYLLELKLRGNDVCRVRRFKDNVVVYSPYLQVIDNFTIFDNYRSSLMRWRQKWYQNLAKSNAKTRSLALPFLEVEPVKEMTCPLPQSQSAPELVVSLKELSEMMRTKSSITV